MEEVRGTVQVNVRGFGFLEWTDGERRKSAFIAPSKLREFLHLDVVDATVERDKRGLAATALRLVQRPRELLFGTVGHDDAGRLQLTPDPEVANRPRRIHGSDVGRLTPGMFVTGELVKDGVYVISVVPEDQLELARIRDRYLVRHPFADEVLEAAAAAEPTRTTGWRDLRELPTLTIDAPHSRDLDDALSVLPAQDDGAMRVFVHIADVDSVVPAGSIVDHEARKRGTSVYLAGGVTPMLPPALSEDRLSLIPGEERPTLTVELRIDAEGETRSVDIYPSTIRSDARLSYEQVDRFLRGHDVDLPEPLLEALSWLRTLSGRLAAVRAARGGVVFDRYESVVELDDAQHPVAVHARRQTPAHLLIERTMVAANEAVARWLLARGLPGVYRVHPAPTDARVDELEASLERMGFTPGLAAPLTPRAVASLETQLGDAGLSAVLQEVLAQVLDRARYTVHGGPHFGLGSDAYLHFTSPIRRYADLAVHRVVKAFLAGERALEAGDPAIEALAVHLNDCTARAAKAEAARRRTLVARWAADRIGEAFDGHVIAVKPFGLIVQLGGTGATGAIPTGALPGSWSHEGHQLVGEGDSWAIGDAIRVRIDTVDEARGRIDLAPTEAGPKKRRRRRRKR